LRGVGVIWKLGARNRCGRGIGGASEGTNDCMSMADNRRNRPEYSDDAYEPKPNEPSDPLAELARLIGQSDPFTDTPRGTRKPPDSLRAGDRAAPELRATPDQRATPEWLSRPSTAPAGDDYDPRPAPRHADDARYQDDPHDHAEHQDHEDYAGDYPDEHADAQNYQHDDRYRVAPPPPVDYDNDGYYTEDGHMPPEGEETYAPPRRRGGLMTVVAVIGLAVIGTAGAFAYRSFTGSSNGSASPPVIKADPSPAKIVPPSPTAADAQNKPFQDRVAGASPERVVPREEQPVSLPVPPRPTVANPQTAFAPSAGASNAAPLVAPPAATNPSSSEPRRVRTMTIRPDSMADPAPPPQQQAAAPPPTRSAAPAPTPPAPAAKQPPSPMAIAPQDAPSSRSKVAARTPPAQAAGGAYWVQVSAQKTEEEAGASYQALQQKYPNVLGGREAAIRRADLGDKGVYYRAQVGPFANSEAASSFCSNLKTAGGQCIVQKN
jgi:hypothetical protein